MEPRDTRPVRRVRKRDGRVVEFDEQKIADAIYKAALSVGAQDRFLAEEMASVVTLFLEKTFPDSIPGIEDVQDMVERVLIETGHARTAKAYILYRERHARLREAESCSRGPVQRELFAPGPVTCLDAVAERVRRLDGGGLARQIEAETGLPAEIAEAVSGAVLERLKGLGTAEVRGALLDRLIDVELASRGYLPALAARAGKAIAPDRLAAALFPKEGERERTPADRAGRTLLRQYSIEDMLPAPVAAAHLEGRIHVRGLSAPTSVFAACLSPDAVRFAPAPGVPGRFRPSAVGTPRRFIAHLGRQPGPGSGR